MGCWATRVHVHACLCACWAACLIWWHWIALGENIPSCSVENKDQLSVPPPNPLHPSSPCPAASRLREKHCIQTEGFGHFSAESCQQGFGEKNSSAAGLVPSSPSSFPSLVHHALAAASWALTERQGCGAYGGWGLWGLGLPAALPLTEAHWCLKCSLSLGPSVPKLKL